MFPGLCGAGADDRGGQLEALLLGEMRDVQVCR